MPQPDSSQPLRPALTARQERFAQLAATGISQAAAARQAGYAGSSERSLRRSARVQARIVELRGKVEARGEELALLSLAEKRRFLAELIRTPVAGVGPDSWLAQEWERIEIPSRSAGAPPSVKSKVKLADKLRAIELDSKLANHFPGKDDEDSPQKPAADGMTLEKIQDIARRVKVVSPLLWRS